LGIIIDTNLTWLEHINYIIYNKILKFTSIFIRYVTYNMTYKYKYKYDIM